MTVETILPVLLDGRTTGLAIRFAPRFAYEVIRIRSLAREAGPYADPKDAYAAAVEIARDERAAAEDDVYYDAEEEAASLSARRSLNGY